MNAICPKYNVEKNLHKSYGLACNQPDDKQSRESHRIPATCSGHRAYCQAELEPFSSLAVAVTIASTHFANPCRDDQAELAWVA